MSPASGSPRDAAYRLLSRRSHSRAELEQKLSRKGFNAEDIASVLSEFSAKGYLNDDEVALRWAQGLVRTKCWGRAKISAYLAQKGINRETVDRVQREVWQEFSEETVARRAFQKRFAAAKTAPSPAKAAAFLKSRGFSAAVIYKLAGGVVADEIEE